MDVMGNNGSQTSLETANLPAENYQASPGTVKVDYEGEETLTYAGEEFHTTACGAKAMLDKFGIAIIPNVLTPEECSQMNDGMWSTAEHLTSKLDLPVRRSDPTTYASLLKLKPIDGAGLFHDFGWKHAQYVWDARANPKVGEAFEEIFGTKDLLVSIDGANCGLTSLIEDPCSTKAEKGLFTGSRNQMRLHCEQRYSMNDFEMVQSWVTANAIKVGDGTLRVIPGSHKLHAEFKNAFRTGKDNSRNWHSLTEHQIDWLIKRGCRDICIVAPSGSQVLWDSRTVHCGQKALSTEDLSGEVGLKDEPRTPRNVVYIAMVPTSYANENCMKVRKIMFEDAEEPYISSGHRPHEMKTSKPLVQVDFEVPKLPTPILNDRAKKLAGL